MGTSKAKITSRRDITLNKALCCTQISGKYKRILYIHI